MTVDKTLIHRNEVLIALDYLLRFSNESNPARISDIVKYAQENYNVKLNRRVMSSPLHYLKDFSENHSDCFPFVIEEIEMRNGSLYYVDQKYNMTNDKLYDLLVALENDKYFKEEDKEFYKDILLETFTNKYDEDLIREKLKSTNIKRQKVRGNRKLGLAKKALQEDKLLLTRLIGYDTEKKKIVNYNLSYRVYKIIEYNNRPYAILLQIDKTKVKLFVNNILLPIDSLDIVGVTEDLNPKRDLNELFKNNFPNEFNTYGSLDNYIDLSIMPKSGKIIDVKFYFSTSLLTIIQWSFSTFFNENLKWKKVTEDYLVKKYDIMTTPYKNDYILVETKIDRNAFLAWCFSDPHNDGVINILSMIFILEPSDIIKSIRTYYTNRLIDLEHRYGR